MDFELELIHRDEINLAYILRLIAKLKQTEEKEYALQKKNIMGLLSGEGVIKTESHIVQRIHKTQVLKLPIFARLLFIGILDVEIGNVIGQNGDFIAMNFILIFIFKGLWWEIVNNFSNKRPGASAGV